MKRKAASNESHAGLTKIRKMHLTAWQVHLKNFSKTEGMLANAN